MFCALPVHQLSVKSGSEVLYVGDHIYGDIQQSKKAVGWRTMLVLPEIEMELRVMQREITAIEELAELRRQRMALEDQIECMEWQLANGMAMESILGGENWEDVDRFKASINSLRVSNPTGRPHLSARLLRPSRLAANLGMPSVLSCSQHWHRMRCCAALFDPELFRVCLTGVGARSTRSGCKTCTRRG